MKQIIINTGAITALFLSSMAANAHATLEQKEAQTGTTTEITLRVPHGCDGEVPHALRGDTRTDPGTEARSPKRTLLASSHGDDAAMAMGAKAVIVGSIEIKSPFVRATLPNQPAGGGFMTLTNIGSEEDRLIAGASEISERVEIHEMKMDGDVMKMRELADGLPVPAGETVELKPGGYHIMFMGLKGPFVEGETVEVQLTFEKAGEVTIQMPVAARDAKDMDHSNH